MPDTLDPADVVRAVAEGVCRLVAGGLDDAGQERQLDDLARLYAEHTDVRHPFAPIDQTVLRTRADLRRHFAGAPAFLGDVERWETVDMTVHRTADPEVVIPEFRYERTVGGRSFSVPNIFVVRVRDGEIVESRDYADHLGLARALGRAGDLVAALDR